MRWVSLGALAAAGVLLAAFWGDIPDRWITHWGVHGPDGWATKSAASAAIPLVLGLGLWLLFDVLAFATARGGARTGFPREMMQVVATVVRAVGMALALMCAGLGVALPLFQPRSSLPIAVGIPLFLAVVVGGAMVWAWGKTRRLRAAGVALPEGYTGVFYTNPRDSRLWVPKVAGVGWTINFAHRWAWPVMVALVGVPLGIALLVARIAH
jgi:uncharacterized membrane protein